MSETCSVQSLTIDNAQLSKVKAGPEGTAGNGQRGSLDSADVAPHIAPKLATTAEVHRYASASLAANSIRAYDADLRAFLSAGGTLPATPYVVAAHLASQADARTPATLARRLVAIGKAHLVLGLPNPCDAEIVRATLRGIRRTHGVAQRQAEPLLREDLMCLLPLFAESAKGVRDRALLLVGFAGALRRSELASIRFEDLRFVAEGLVLRLPRSKTDQEGRGREIGIPFARSRACPVKALRAWLDLAQIDDGPVFLAVTKGGQISSKSITGAGVALILKTYVAAAGLDAAKYSGHSLRSGLLTSAAKAGVSSWKLRQQSGHRSEAMLARYIRDGNLFVDNAAGAVL